MKPILFHLFHEPIYSYPLMMGLGWGVGFNVTKVLWKERGLSSKILSQFFILSFILAWIGAKLFFLIFSTPEKAMDYGAEINFWLGGGFVFYGGLVFAGSFAIFFFKNHPQLRFSDVGLITPGLALGHAIGRIGCLLAGCCFGTYCDLPHAIIHQGVPRHPVQAYEAFILFFLFFILMKQRRKPPLFLGALYLLIYSIGRFSLEFFRGDLIRGLYLGLSTSQWVSIFLFAMGVAGLWFFLKKEKKN